MTQKTYKTPGIKPIEKRVFGRTVSTKMTAVPIFIGYTQRHPSETPEEKDEPQSSEATKKDDKADASGDDFKAKKTPSMAKNKAGEGQTIVVERINSFSEYTALFGGGDYTRKGDKVFYLFESIKLFYANGGSTCYIVSVGSYSDNKVEQSKLESGLEKVFELSSANLVLAPDAVSLNDTEKGSFYDTMLKSCSFKNRHEVFINQFAILDAKKGLQKHNDEQALERLSNDEHLVHGAMYHPWLKTDAITRADVERSLVEGDLEYIKKQFQLKKEDTDALKELSSPAAKASYIRRAKRAEWSEHIDTVIEKNSLIPPSGAVAGAFVRSDQQFGIQKAPANINLRGVSMLNTVINDTNQGDFNAPENGKSINCIRSFVNNDIKIWGARTLDCNDLDYRYVNVRRTMSMMQDSIKNLLEKFVFEDNTERTWLKIRASLGKFLKSMLRRGYLVGTTPSDAYEFSLGLGETMDESDINEGIIRIVVKLALVRPAEFIEIIFEQKSMEGEATVEAEEGGEEGSEE